MRLRRTPSVAWRIGLALGFLLLSSAWVIYVLRPMFTSDDVGSYEGSNVGFLAPIAGLILAALALTGPRERRLTAVLAADAILLGAYLLFVVARS
jgi:peptidoglycan/LPS O-acetylase OafA/YrhL